MSLITEGIFRGSSLLINPTTAMATYILGDYYGYKECCLLSDSCAVYFSTRVTNECSGYRPPGMVWGFGLSHVITADSNQYRVNKVGTYVIWTGLSVWIISQLPFLRGVLVANEYTPLSYPATSSY